MKQSIYDYIQSRADDFIAVSDRIWEFAELSLNEYKSVACYLDFLRKEGFTIREQVANVPTAFAASYGSGSPRIGILAEYDALSSLSQRAGVAEKDPLVPGGHGHGCGHNLLGAGSLAAAVTIKKLIELGHLKGTVVFYGCPGEEGCAGKSFMARDGEFRDLDAAITWHPGDTNEVTTGSNAACLQYLYSFQGQTAHAAGDPHLGRSALDAAELMNVGVQFLREHMRKCESVHYSFLDVGGPSPNVVQPTASVLYMVRSDNVRNAKSLLERVHNIARGACLMTGTEVSIRQVDGTASTLSNTVLEKVIHKNLEAAPLPVYTDDELAFAEAIHNTYDCRDLPGTAPRFDWKVKQQVKEWTNNGQKAVNDFVMPYVPSDYMSAGSTDVGDVSWLTPTAQFNAATWPSNCPGHSWQMVSTGKTVFAHEAMLYAGCVLAMTAYDLMTDPAILTEARAEFSVTAAGGYDCPLEPDLVAEPAAI
ncbi:MAG: amidohydrolase [Oscillospiraceae bacterium]|nr:amidohydrolase [Oscillospiraceae bacterium]